MLKEQRRERDAMHPTSDKSRFYAKPTYLKSCSCTRMLFQADNRNCAAIDAQNASGSPCLFTMPRSQHVFPKASCISVLYVRNHTLPVASFLLLPFAVFDLLTCPLSRYFSMLFRNFFWPSKEFLSDIFVRISIFRKA